jgi:hypothetical protein
MKPSRSLFAVLAALIVFGSIGVASGSAFSPRHTGGDTLPCFNDDTLQFSEAVYGGAVLHGFSVDNPCNTWFLMAFLNNNSFIDVVYVPPGTPAVPVSLQALSEVGLSNLHFDGLAGGGGAADFSACNPNLAGIPSYAVEADGSLKPLSC